MKIKVTIPTSLEDIKLSQYQKFLKTTEKSEDNDWINKQIVGIFCNLPDDIVKKLPKRDFNSIVNSITKVLNEKPELKKIIKLNGIEYGFIPNLDEITVGEQADIDNFVKDWQKMDRVMGILYRPITYKKDDNYLIEEYRQEEIVIKERIRRLEKSSNSYINRIKIKNNKIKLSKVLEEYKTKYSLDLSMDAVNGSLSFFLTLLQDLLNCTQSYMSQVVQEPKTSQLLEQNGVGINQFMQSLEVTFLNLRQSLDLNYTRL